MSHRTKAPRVRGLRLSVALLQAGSLATPAGAVRPLACTSCTCGAQIAAPARR